MEYKTNSIRNIVFAGHSGSGKSALFERLLGGAAAGGAAKAASSSSEAAFGSVVHKNIKINFFDTPGSPDFSGEAILSFRAAETAALVIDAKAGVQIETVKLARALEKKPRCIIITKPESERASFDNVLRDIKEKLKITPVPFTLPAGEGEDFRGVVDVLSECLESADEKGEKGGAAGAGGAKLPVPPEFKDAAVEARLKLMEIAADGDEILMEKYILLGALEPEDVFKGLQGAFEQNLYVPVFTVSALRGAGVGAFLDFCADIAGSPEVAREFVLDSGSPEETNFDFEAPFSAFVIKTVFDQFSGKLSWVKVVRGSLAPDADIFNLREKKKERCAKIYTFTGKKFGECGAVYAGDVCVLAKVASLKTNDTIAVAESALPFVPLRHPLPVYSLAVQASEKKDDAKMGDFFTRISEEDKTFRMVFNAETKETVISGMGEMHINMILEKLKSSQKVEVKTSVPRVAYRETISKKASAEYTHKKQTGGHGQYGKVLLEINPLGRGAGYNFINAIFGGAVPKNYIPGVEKGIQEAMSRGVLASYPVVDVEVKLVDGKYHPVDSSELSFSLAARNAFKLAMKDAAPLLLEPVMNLTVFVESCYLGDVLSDLSVKRGKIISQSPLGGGIEEVKAQVPQSELLRYSVDLRSITSGTGSFSVEESHYAPLSGRLADEVIKAAAAFKGEDSEE